MSEKRSLLSSPFFNNIIISIILCHKTSCHNLLNHNIFLTNTNIPQHTYSYPRTATLKFCRNILSNRVNITFCSYSFPYILRNHKWKGLLHANEDFVQSRNLFLWLRSLFSKDTSSFSLITLSIS